MSKNTVKKVLLASLIGGLFASVTGCLPTTKLPGNANTPAVTPASGTPASSTPAK